MRRAVGAANLANTQLGLGAADHHLGGDREAAKNGTEEIQANPRPVNDHKLAGCLSAFIHFLRFSFLLRLWDRIMSDLSEFGEIEAGSFANLTHLRTM